MVSLYAFQLATINRSLKVLNEKFHKYLTVAPRYKQKTIVIIQILAIGYVKEKL